jgi:hypothetical protein
MLESVDSVRDEVVDEGTMGVEGGPKRILERTELELTEDVKCKDEGVGALVGVFGWENGKGWGPCQKARRCGKGAREEFEVVGGVGIGV